MTDWLFLLSSRPDRHASSTCEPARLLAQVGQSVTVVAMDDYAVDLVCGSAGDQWFDQGCPPLLVDRVSLQRRGLAARSAHPCVSRREIAGLILASTKVVWR